MTKYYGKKIYPNCTYMNFLAKQVVMTKSLIRHADHCSVFKCGA